LTALQFGVVHIVHEALVLGKSPSKSEALDMERES